MSSCPFCDTQKLNGRLLRENKLCRVVLSNPRLMPGHTLVIPKRHLERPWELTPAELQEIFQNIWWVEGKLLASIATGCDVRQNYRPFLAQSKVKIDHLHFHVLPRTNEDQLFQKSMRFERELFADLSTAEEKMVAKLFET